MSLRSILRCSRSLAQPSRSISYMTPGNGYLQSVSHLTDGERRMYAQHRARKNRQSRETVPQTSVTVASLRPSIYDPTASAWTADRNPTRTLARKGSIIRLVSWNLEWSTPASAARVSAALNELKTHFTASPEKLVVMLQEVSPEMLQAIMRNHWVQKNFALSDLDAPTSSYTHIAGDGFVVSEWGAAPSFTVMMMISRDIAVINCLRSPLVSRCGRDALVVDIAIREGVQEKCPTKVLRLCTTHLESGWERPRRYRPTQLSAIAALLKGFSAPDCTIVGGVVGGDMNAIDLSETDLHRANEVNLKDAWEDEPPPPSPPRKPGQQDLTYGRAGGHTSGYQSLDRKPRYRSRLDKFFYTGMVKPVAIQGIGDLSGKIG
ncbi:MAG: hypothetical protein Q9169_001563 [Polycauliona sp. 2 TL-2023]